MNIYFQSKFYRINFNFFNYLTNSNFSVKWHTKKKLLLDTYRNKKGNFDCIVGSFAIFNSTKSVEDLAVSRVIYDLSTIEYLRCIFVLISETFVNPDYKESKQGNNKLTKQ